MPVCSSSIPWSSMRSPITRSAAVGSRVASRSRIPGSVLAAVSSASVSLRNSVRMAAIAGPPASETSSLVAALGRPAAVPNRSSSCTRQNSKAPSAVLIRSSSA